MIKTLNLNVSGTWRDVTRKQRPDRFPSAGDHIHATSSFEHAWISTRHTVIRGSQKYMEEYQFLRVHEHSNCNIYEVFFTDKLRVYSESEKVKAHPWSQ